MDAFDVLKILDEPVGVSGGEKKAAETVKALFSQVCDEVYEDRLGNVVGFLRCKKPGAPLVLIEAHMDEVGLMVSGYSEEGSLFFEPVGGIDVKILPGSEVTIHAGEPLFGVIGAVPPHLLKEGDKVPEMSEMVIDAGLSPQRARERIPVGSFVSFNTNFERLSGGFAAARCFDNRAGVAAIILAAQMIGKEPENCSVALLAAVREEVRTSGAAYGAAQIKPDCAVCVDVCHGVTHDNRENAFACGGGAVVSVGPNLHPRLTKELLDCAKKQGISCEIDVDSGNTGTDAWSIQITGEGIPCALISIPLRYMHTNYEVMDVSDVKSCAELMAAFARGFKGGDSLCC